MKPIESIPDIKWAKSLSQAGKRRTREVYEFVKSGAKYAEVEFYASNKDIKSENASYRQVCDRINRTVMSAGFKVTTHVRGEKIYLERVKLS